MKLTQPDIEKFTYFTFNNFSSSKKPPPHHTYSLHVINNTRLFRIPLKRNNISILS